MAINPFEGNQSNFNAGGQGFGGAGGGGFGGGFSPGSWSSPVQNTSNPIIRGGQRSPMEGGQTAPPSLNSLGGFGGWRNQMTGLGGSPYTYMRPQNPWQQQQGGPWGMANRSVNPYGGQNTADPRFQQNIAGVGNPFGQSTNSPFSWMQQGGVNPMWQALMQQRFMPQQQQPQQRDLWIMGQNPYAPQQPSTGQGMQGPAPTQGQGMQRYASDNRRKPDHI